MSHAVDVVYDGEDLRPLAPLDLAPDGHYHVAVQEQAPGEGARFRSCSDFLKWIADNAEDLGVDDLAEQHDHYLWTRNGALPTAFPL